MNTPGSNMLGNALSPYLRMHATQAIHWREWNEETLALAKSQQKPLLVSVGYASCHWCHVMASEAFSDADIADLLNQHFIAVKVDREERPDVDQFMMDILLAQDGQGGWPLNVFLDSELRPMYGTTYLPARSRDGIPGFGEVLLDIITMGSGTPFRARPASQIAIGVEDYYSYLKDRADQETGGVQETQKFPHASRLLALLYTLEYHPDPGLEEWVLHTLRTMACSGLYDQLQGGFFRYTVDDQWHWPHFEKMLTDQAMLLWVYIIAAKQYPTEGFQSVVQGIYRCLEETFALGDLYGGSLDADTEGYEGATYLWTQKELESIVSDSQRKKLQERYILSPQEGHVHLRRRRYTLEQDDLEETLLYHRKQRKQPTLDSKVLCSWNALLAIAYLHGGRYHMIPRGIERAQAMYETLCERYMQGQQVLHGSEGTQMMKQGFLEDVASLALLGSFLQEDGKASGTLSTLLEILQRYCPQGQWITAEVEGLGVVPAAIYDEPYLSGVTMAQWVLWREKGEISNDGPVLSPYSEGANPMRVQQQGAVHRITSPLPLDWRHLPLNALQYRGTPAQDCFHNTCRPLPKNWT